MREAKYRGRLILVAILMMPVQACENMSPETVARLSQFAGTALNIVGMNYTGKYPQLVSSLINTFNGGAVAPAQAIDDHQDPYGGYQDYIDGAGTELALADASDGQFAAIDASLVTMASDGSLQLLDNGSALRGPASGFAGDRVGIAFAPVSDAYVYVVAIDGTGWTQALFPDAALGHSNPVPGGEEILLPGESLYGLDNVPGIETIYILASNSPRPDLQAQMQPFFGQERPAAGAGMAYRSVSRPIVIARGLTGVRPMAAASQTYSAQPGAQSAAMTSFVGNDDELAVTLWFNHE